jgi:predicted RNA-binding Zn-ribbon protein involved in translation (DUF1610 family)
VNCPNCGAVLEEIQDISVKISLSGSEGGEDELEERSEDQATRWRCPDPNCGFREKREMK